MDIKMNSFITSIAGILIGTWVAHTYTWNIKNKIKNLDKMLNSTLAVHYWFYEFIRLLNNVTNRDLKDQKIERQRITGCYTQDLNQIKISDSIVDEYFDNEINELEEYIKIFINKKDDGANKFEGSADEKLYNKHFHALTDKITKRRKELISFKYMLKQLVMNRFSLVGILLIIIFLLFQCYNNTQQLTVIHYIIQNIH